MVAVVADVALPAVAALRFATCVVLETTKGAVPVGSVTVTCVKEPARGKEKLAPVCATTGVDRIREMRQAIFFIETS